MDQEKEFIEEFALYFERSGFMRMAGRILAWLLICDPAHQTLAGLVEVLQASKSSVSTSARHLMQAGFVERVSFPGERRDYYRLRADFCSMSYERFVTRIDGLAKMTGKGLALLEGSPQKRLERLAEAHDIFLFMKQEMPMLLEQWKTSYTGKKTAATKKKP